MSNDPKDNMRLSSVVVVIERDPGGAGAFFFFFFIVGVVSLVVDGIVASVNEDSLGFEVILGGGGAGFFFLRVRLEVAVLVLEREEVESYLSWCLELSKTLRKKHNLYL